MKKTVSMIISLALIMSLSACGSTQNVTGESENNSTVAKQEVSGEVGGQTVNETLQDGVVRTTAGLVHGNQKDGIYTFLGLKYAEAKERFIPASDVAPWDGTLEADSYGKISYQGTVVGMRGSNGSNNDNDCQNLNIWTPGTDDAKRPVMVWLHGGGFSTGSANESMYDGANLSKLGDVVVIGVNHRLNVFGHLDLSAYGEKYQYSANVGIMDIQMALQWIQDNVSGFGGDPENVTIFGQSGGGAKVLSMMTSPYAKGLFQKGIVQSGATEIMGVSFSNKEISERIGEETLKNLGISPENVEDIQKVSLDELIDASDRARETVGEEYGVYLALSTDYGIEWGPVIDGDYMPTAPVTDDGFAEAGKDIPLLIGNNFTEWTHWMSMSMHSDMTDEQIAAFREAYPGRDVSDAPYVDSFIRLPMLKIMSHKADQGGADVYAYLYNYGSDPYHGIEISSVFHKLNNLNPYYYYCHLFSELAKLSNEKGYIDIDALEATALDDLLPWSTKLPKECYKGRR